MKEKRTYTKWIPYLMLLVAGILFTVSCSTSDDTSLVAFKLTDAPDTSGITNVMITVSQIKVNASKGCSRWSGGKLEDPHVESCQGGGSADVGQRSDGEPR